jgi:hypothetical protein
LGAKRFSALPTTSANHRASGPRREFCSACRSCGVADAHAGEQLRQLLDRLWVAGAPEAAGGVAAASAAVVSCALRYAQAEALCSAQQRSTGHFLAATSVALRDAALS